MVRVKYLSRYQGIRKKESHTEGRKIGSCRIYNQCRDVSGMSLAKKGVSIHNVGKWDGRGIKEQKEILHPGHSLQITTQTFFLVCLVTGGSRAATIA